MLQGLREELELIRSTSTRALETLAKLGAGFGPPAGVTRVPEEPTGSIMDRIRDVLPEDVLPKLTLVRQVDGFVTITATWLGKGAFEAVTQAVKSMGGTWISAGKESRWEVPIGGG